MTLSLTAKSQVSFTASRATAGTSVLTSDTVARWSATASSARFTAGDGVLTAPTATSPIKPDRPSRALRLRVFPVREQYGCVFGWHQPDGEDPQWELPDLFHKFRQFDTDPDAYYRPYPEFSSRAEHEPVHPQIVAENGPDSAHFHYVHGATVTPVCLNWEAVDEEWRFLTGWPDVHSDDPNKMALYIHSHFSGLGFAISAFEGSSNHRLIFACTPVEDGYSDMFYSIWWPRLPGDTSEVPPDEGASRSSGSSWERCGRTWTSGAIRNTSSSLRCPRSTRNPIWPCASGRRNSTRRPQQTRSRPRETGPRRDRGSGTYRNLHAGVSGRGRRTQRRAGRAGRGGTTRGSPQHRTSAASGPRCRGDDRALPHTAAARRSRRQPEREDLRHRKRCRHLPRPAGRVDAAR